VIQNLKDEKRGVAIPNSLNKLLLIYAAKVQHLFQLLPMFGLLNVRCMNISTFNVFLSRQSFLHLYRKIIEH
jgi:hypothetical protein